MSIPIAKLVTGLADALTRGDGYIMGAYGQNPRTGYLDLNVTDVKAAWKPTGWYYAQYSDPTQRAQALKWREKCVRVWDCNGLAEGIYEIETGKSINSMARYNYAQWCDPKGEGIIPAQYRVPGAAVFWGSKASSIEHVAYLFEPVEAGKPSGDWYLIEARGVMKGVVRTKLSERNPKFWGWMTKYYDYTSSVQPSSGILQRGDKGEAVRVMQSALISLGYDLGKWGADGEFGAKTEAAVKQFQHDHGLPETGIFGPVAQAKLDKLKSAAEDLKMTFTVTIHGVTQAGVNDIQAKWPNAEVTQE